MSDYSDYYGRTIAFGENGFKLVLGGTGLGKTRGIRGVLNGINEGYDHRKFVYVANRIQLLNEMYKELVADGFASGEVVHLERNRDTVQNALSKSDRSDFYKLLRSDMLRTIASSGNLDLVAIERYCKRVEDLLDFFNEEDASSSINRIMEHSLETYTRHILFFFKQILLRAGDKKPALLQNPIIQTLFPYIAFSQNPRAKILLITIHKGYLGFFDGEQDINLMQLQDHIIFLDEFDFLESDLIELICSAPQIEDPFLFVEMFYRAMTRHKLPLNTYPFHPNVSLTTDVDRIRTRLDDIVKEIGKLSKEDRINFPAINQFTTAIRQKQAVIFQTNRMILRTPLYLQETDRSFEIVQQEQPGTKPALDLFNTVQWATNRILFLFNDIASISRQMYNEMLEHCFPQSYLADQVRNVSQFPQAYKAQYTRFGNLLSAGFGLYEIQDLQQVTDEDEVKFRHYAIHTTPERVVLSMAQNNLVFGLSATADISRLVKHFNIPWLKQELNSENDGRYFEVSEADEAIIQDLNARKLEARQNSVKFEITPSLEDFAGGDELKDYIFQIADHFPGFGENDRSGYRRRRVENFFATLLWALNTRTADELQLDTHLMFLNSFRQIHFILSNPDCHEGTDLFNVDTIPLGDSKHFSAYQLEIADQLFFVVFYDARYAREVYDSDQIKHAYNELFWENIPVIVVTQYASAGNGVNLQYYPSEEAKVEQRETDFRNVHLLDKPFFFFDAISPSEQTSQELITALKKNLWYAAKLFEGKIITASRFFNLLENLRNYNFNREYNHSSNRALNADALKNRMSMYIQGLGRIERVWDLMPVQTVCMSLEVFDDFAMYYTDNTYEQQCDISEPRISNNLRQLKEKIVDEARQRKRQARNVVDETLPQRNAQCESRIRDLLRQLDGLRAGLSDEEQAQYIRKTWRDLRRAALQHDFANPILEEYSATIRSSYYQNGELYLDQEYNLYPPNEQPPGGFRWRLDNIYDVVRENEVICHYFLRTSRSYELEFSPSTDVFFTPYFYQSVLVGAIGEAAIEALLKQNFVRLDDQFPDELFELADLKIEGKPWYIDCKNYSERTMSHFALAEEDPAYRPSLTDATFEAKTRSKLEAFRRFHSGQAEDCKFIYLNLVSSGNRMKRYIKSDDFSRNVPFDEADVIVIQGIIQPDNPQTYNTAFEQFIDDIQQRI